MAVIIKNMEMPKDCRHCKFSSKSGMDYKCIVDEGKMHPSWIERSLEIPIRPCNCLLKEENMVSEEVYTQEYTARKESDLKVYKFERAIEDFKAEIEEERDSILHSYGTYEPNEVLDIIDRISNSFDKHISKEEQTGENK